MSNEMVIQYKQVIDRAPTRKRDTAVTRGVDFSAITNPAGLV